MNNDSQTPAATDKKGAQPISLADFQTLTTTQDIAVIDFWAVWCGPCQMMSPIIDSFASDSDFKDVRILKVNVDEQPELSQQFNVRAIPTFLVVKFSGDGTFDTALRVTGAQDGMTFKQNLLEVINPLLSK